MLEMQAVIGRIQLAHMPGWTQARTHNAAALLQTCRRFAALRVPELPAGSEHAFYKCYVYVRPEQLAPGWSRDRIIEAINAHGVPCYQGSCSEVYLEKAFDATPWRPSDRLPHARALGETSVMFLVHPTLTEAEIEQTCKAISEVFGQACA